LGGSFTGGTGTKTRFVDIYFEGLRLVWPASFISEIVSGAIRDTK
jgi:hypothetical protein